MAGIAIPDNMRPALAAITKYHFWILAAIVPLVLVPALIVGGADLRTRIAAQRRQIESKLGQAKGVTAVQPHPNEAWRTAIDADAAAVTQETLDEWRRFWHSQMALRIWPAELGDAFLNDVAKLQPGGKLDRNSLLRYQRMASQLVSALPRRMGVEDAMVAQPREGAPADAARPAAPAALPSPLAWNPASQKRLHDTFVWSRVPTTTQIVLAQEELWVYGLFCDLIAGFVKGATGAHDSALTWVDELMVGFPVNVETGKDRDRIMLPKGAEGATDGAAPGMVDPSVGPEAGAQAPSNPRYTGSAQPVGGEQPAVPTEDAYRGWVYIDLSGKPLSPTDLAAAPDMQMVHLMPFVLRVVMDQRQIDRLLVTLAAVSVPIDVRQVRILPRSSAAGAVPRRPHDVVVELRGSVAIATRPVTAAEVKP